MKYIDEYRDRDLVTKLAGLIRKSATGDYVFMEVCGGHTAAIHRFGIPSLLPGNIRLISGPGCPVCVTETDFIDRAAAMARLPGVIVTTFGDLMRVPGSATSLSMEKALGADIRVVLSGLDALEVAMANPGSRVVFLGIGFETTAPGTAVTIIQASKKDISNFYVFSAHKLMPPPMEAIIREGTRVSGFICPGHVAVITGASAFRFIPERHRLGCVVTGFEPADILQAILMLVNQVNRGTPALEIQYRRAVTDNGNAVARGYMNEVFESCDVTWRGFGMIEASGLAIRNKYRRFDAGLMIPVEVPYKDPDRSCLCGQILRGLKTPPECPLFALQCTPENPVGACMVSDEGACNTYFKYRSYE